MVHESANEQTGRFANIKKENQSFPTMLTSEPNGSRVCKRANRTVCTMILSRGKKMKISTDDLLNSILESFDRIEYVKSEDIPNIDLYMDQVTTFMDERMRSAARKPDEDKILTKTMINNYAKNNLLPPPVKKKYSKEHMLMLIFIYYFKGILSIGDIQKLLSPLAEQYFGKQGGLKLDDIYEEVFSLEKEQVNCLKEQVTEEYQKAEKLFREEDDADKAFLQRFSFICMLSFDVYVKKRLIEKLIDDMPEVPVKEKSRGKKEKNRSGHETGK
jgi:hypothetical protein